jgi:hypothetical protein
MINILASEMAGMRSSSVPVLSLLRQEKRGSDGPVPERSGDAWL